MINKTTSFPPVPPDEKKGIFTEGIDYQTTSQNSIWGHGYEETLRLLKKGIIKGGRWLNLAAGDGRYNQLLLQNADSVVATDIDAGALDKLRRNTPDKYKNKLFTAVFDLTKNFPLGDAEFDGIFCTGILHLFPKKVLGKIISEVDRILKPGGKVIFEFPSDIKRLSPEGKIVTFGKEPLYTREGAKQTLRKLFKDYQVDMKETNVIEDFTAAKPPFTFNCTVIILTAEKIARKNNSSTLLKTGFS